MKTGLREGIAYLFWGGVTTVVSWLSYTLFVWLTGQITLSNILSWILAVAFAFVVNKQWVFRSQDWSGKTLWPELGKFLSARLLTGALELVAVPLLAALDGRPLLGVAGLGAKILVTVVVILLNYVFSKLIIFKK